MPHKEAVPKKREQRKNRRRVARRAGPNCGRCAPLLAAENLLSPMAATALTQCHLELFLEGHFVDAACCQSFCSSRLGKEGEAKLHGGSGLRWHRVRKRKTERLFVSFCLEPRMGCGCRDAVAFGARRPAPALPSQLSLCLFMPPARHAKRRERERRRGAMQP